MNVDPRQLAFGFLLALTVAAAATVVGALTAGGAAAATAVGGLVLGLGGWGWAVILVGFFVSSAGLSRWRVEDKRALAVHYTKGERRDAQQVLANGAVGAALAVAVGASGNTVLFAAFVGAMAAVTADTWATELGLLSRVPPRMVTTRQPVLPGTSGAVTALGSAAAAGAGIFIGALAVGVVMVEAIIRDGVPDVTGARFLVIAPVAGLAGAALDSVLGATVQAVRRCPRCEKETELAVHTCGTRTRVVRGWPWLTGDLVNIAASLVGAVLALTLELVIFT